MIAMSFISVVHTKLKKKVKRLFFFKHTKSRGVRCLITTSEI